MPKDIRSFFKPAGTVKTTSPRKDSPEKKEGPEKPVIYKKPTPKKEPTRRNEASKPRKRSQSREKAGEKKQSGKEEDIFIDDDSDDDIVNDTPPRRETKENKKAKEKKTKQLKIEDEEDEFESLKKRKPALVESSDEEIKPAKSRARKKAKIEDSPVEEKKSRKKTKMEESPVEEKKSKKKKAMVIDSESEEEAVKEKKPRKPRKKKEEEPLIGVSDDDQPKINPLKDAFSHAKTPVKPEAKIKEKTPETKKAVSVADFFGTGEVKRTPSVKRKSGTMEEFDDDDFEETLAQIDLQILEQPAKKMKTESSLSEKLATKMATKTLVEDTPVKDKNSNVTKKESKVESPEKMETDISPVKKVATPPKKEVRKEVKVEATTPKSKPLESKALKQEHQSPPSKAPSTPSSIKPASTPSSDAKKIGYRAFKSRSGPQALGSKEIPEGAPNCLEGLTFVITGVQESIDRDELKSLLERYGAKVTGSVSKKTSYVITGREAGESKLNKANQLGTKVIEEDEVFELIRTKPGKVSKYELEAKAQIEKEQKEKEKLEKQQRKKEKTPPRETSLSSSAKINGNSNNNNPGTPTSSRFDSDSQTSQLTASPQVTECKPGEQLLWVDKYKPKTVKNIIGQQGDKSNAKKLLNWLKCWYKNISSGKKPAFGNRWGDDGSGYRAALLSGPPGVGKTTTAHLVCEEAGFSFIELNASDARSKKTLDSQVSEMLHSKTIDKMFGGGKTEAKAKAPTHCLVMDEVDGMAGNEDRGGMAELIALIKKSAIPVICICNDRQSMKVRSLANHCFDLRFQKPRMEQIKSAMMSLAFKEGLKIPPPALNEIITASNQDVRQVIHNLSMWSASSKAMTFDQAKKDARSAIKDIKVGPFEVIRKVFAMDEGQSSIIDKADCFFSDYSLEPLFVQENYNQVNPAAAKNDGIKHLSLLAASADSIADGDVISGKIRSAQAWSLLPLQAIASSVRPGDLMRGYMGQQINFPSWLGKNSSTNKNRRLLEEINSHMHLKVSSDRASLNMDYRPFLKNALFRPLLKEDGSGVQETLDVLDAYDLMKEDFESLMELSQWGQDKNEMSQVQSKTKAALTRKYNQSTRHLPYQCGAGMSKVRKSAEPQFDEEGNLVEDTADDKGEESDDDIGKITSIKAVKAKAPAKKAAEGKGKGKGKKSK